MGETKKTSGSMTPVLLVRYAAGTELARDYLASLPEGGLIVRKVTPYPVGTEVDLSITVGDAPSMRQRARTTWVRGLEDDAMAVRFVLPVEPRLQGILKIALT